MVPYNDTMAHETAHGTSAISKYLGLVLRNEYALTEPRRFQRAWAMTEKQLEWHDVNAIEGVMSHSNG